MNHTSPAHKPDDEGQELGLLKGGRRDRRMARQMDGLERQQASEPAAAKSGK